VVSWIEGSELVSWGRISSVGGGLLLELDFFGGTTLSDTRTEVSASTLKVGSVDSETVGEEHPLTKVKKKRNKQTRTMPRDFIDANYRGQWQNLAVSDWNWD
jgi:hypothetical protein